MTATAIPLPDRIQDRVAAGDRLPVGVAAFAVACMPLLQPKGAGNSAPADMFIAVAIAIVLMWSAGVRARVHVPYAVPMALLMVAGAAGGIAGDAPDRAVVALSQEIFLVFWAAAIATIARDPTSLRVLLAAWAYSSVVWAGILVVAAAAKIGAIAGFAGADGGRASFTFDHPNLAASYFSVSLFVVVLAGYPRRRLARGAAVLTLLAAVVLAGSNAALIGVAAGATIALAVAVARRIDAVAAIGVLIGVGLAALLAAQVASSSGAASAVDQSSNRIIQQSLARSDRSLEQRLTLFGAQLDLFRQGPLLGRGPASTRTELEEIGAPRAKEAHNDYLASLVERGLLGGLGLVALVVAVAVRLARIAPRHLAGPFARVVPGTTALVGAFVMLAVSATTHEVLHYRHVWALLGILAALHVRAGAAQADGGDAS